MAFDPRSGPLLMGIVNITPDSFSDGGVFFDADKAAAHAATLCAEGADIIDIGGESTRPGAVPVDEAAEKARVLPVLRALAGKVSVPISIDTMKARVAESAIEAGAAIVNDVWGFRFDPALAGVCAAAGVHCVLMHNRETEDPTIDIFEDVRAFLAGSVEIALKAGVAEDRIIIDPGIGFAKSQRQSLSLVARLAELKAAFGLPVLLGVSRKRMIGLATGQTVAAERVTGSVAAAVYGVLNGADIIRVHDVTPHRQALSVIAAIRGSGEGRP